MQELYSSKDDMASSVVPRKTVSEAVTRPRSPRLRSKPIGLPFYPGDLVCFRAKKPYEWSPWYGNVVAPDSILLQSLRKSELQWVGADGNGLPDWNYEDGINGTVYVQWTHTSRVGTADESEIGLVDRQLARGTRVKSLDGVKGTVTSSTTRVTVQVLNTNHVIDNVPINELHPVSAFVRGIEILYHGWVGVIMTVRRSVECRLDGGFAFNLKINESDGFMRTDPFWGNGTPCPGVRNKFAPSILKKAEFSTPLMRFVHKWFPPASYFYSSSTATIVSVAAMELEVRWLQKSPASKLTDDTPPPAKINQRSFPQIKILGTPSYDTVALNSVRMYGVKTSDAVVGYASWFAAFQSKYFGVPIANYSHIFSPSATSVNQWAANKGYEVPVKVISRSSQVEIEWDNGVCERMPAIRVPYLLKPKEDRHFPLGLVVEPVLEAPGFRGKYGVVQLSDDCDTSVSKLVDVKWIMPGTETETGETVDLGLKRESIYDLKPHRTVCMFRKGTVVFIKKHSKGYVAGTVRELDVRAGHVIVAVPECRELIKIWPHNVSPLSQRCYWNFFARKWIVEEMLPPLYQFVIENGNGTPSESALPVSLSANNNNTSQAKLNGTIWDESVYALLPEAPATHRYHDIQLKNLTPELVKALQVEAASIKDNVPEGIWVRAYENRLDLYSALILGPEKTPYEDGLFLFDIQIKENFPNTAPKVHFVPYTPSVSPFIAHDGTFCVSKLDRVNSPEPGTPASYVTDVLAKIQELIFTAEPYYSFLGKDSEVDTPKGASNSRAYNEQIFLSVLSSSYNMALKPYDPWRRVIRQHLSSHLPDKTATVKQWISLMDSINEGTGSSTDMDTQMPPTPSYPLLPVSKGFQLALASRIEKIEELLPSADDEPVLDIEVAGSGSGSTVSGLTESRESTSAEAIVAEEEEEVAVEEEPEAETEVLAID